MGKTGCESIPPCVLGRLHSVGASPSSGAGWRLAAVGRTPTHRRYRDAVAGHAQRVESARAAHMQIGEPEPQRSPIVGRIPITARPGLLATVGERRVDEGLGPTEWHVNPDLVRVHHRLTEVSPAVVATALTGRATIPILGANNIC